MKMTTLIALATAGVLANTAAMAETAPVAAPGAHTTKQCELSVQNKSLAYLINGMPHSKR
jgi:hypothetical protein